MFVDDFPGETIGVPLLFVSLPQGSQGISLPKALSEVWSTTDGRSWESSGDAPWPARAGFGLAADEKQIYLAGGQSCWEHPGESTQLVDVQVDQGC